MRNNVKNKLVYRLRNFGYQVDTSNKQVYVTPDNEHKKLVDRLVNEFGFMVSDRMFDEKTGGRVLVIYGEDSVLSELRTSGYIVISCRNERFEDWLKCLLKSDIVYFGHGWESSGMFMDYLALMGVADKLDRKVIIR